MGSDLNFQKNKIKFDCNELEKICNFLKSTQGIDKLYRLSSYLSKLLAEIFLKYSKIEVARRFSNLSVSLSKTRAILRLVGLLHTIQKSKKLLDEHEIMRKEGGVPKKFNLFEFWTTIHKITRILTNYWYLPCDNLALLGKEKIIILSNEQIGKLSRYSARSWTVGLVTESIDLIINNPIVKFVKNCKYNQRKKEFYLRVILVCGDLPLALNFSAQSQFLNQFQVSLFGTISSVSSIYLRWNDLMD